MGYRSDVAIIMPEQTFQKLQNKIAVIKDYDTKQEVYQLLNEATIFRHEETKDVLIYWADIKWYETDPEYKDLVFIDNFLHSLSDNDYAFLRIGEDVDDNEVFGDYWSEPFEAYLEHNIHFYTDNCKQITIG